MKPIFLPLILFLCAVLSACMAPQTRSLRTAQASAEPGRVEIAQVPFFPQETHQCGPAALAAMLNFTGKQVSPEKLAEQVYIPGRRGSLAVELAAAARRQGRLVYPIAPQLDAILTALQQGYPVLVLQNNGLPVVLPFWHFAVVVGADRAQEKFILRSGLTERLEVPFATFERTWARANYWGMLVLDTAQLPDTLEARMVVRELALLEKAGAIAEAHVGFNRAVLNWPEQKAGWLGLASTSLRLGQPDRAEATLRELVRRAPEYGPGLNNLADLLLKTGRPLEALPLAQRAVAVLDIPVTRATLQASQQAVEPVKSEALPPLPGEQPVVIVRKPARKKVTARKKPAAKTASKSVAKPAARTASKNVVKPVGEAKAVP